MNTLEGKTAIVTGAGRSRGIGRAAARELARRGAAVVVTDLARRVEETDMFGIPTVAEGTSGLEEAVAEIAGFGGRALAVSCDVTNSDEVGAAVERTVDEFGGVDIVFNNAGTPVGAKPFFELTDRDWKLSWDVNVMGMVHFSRAVVPLMREQGRGSIINNSSLAGVRGFDAFAGYNATKFAVVGLTKALAMEFGPDGIRVNAICPGDIDTQMADLAIELSEATGTDYGQEMPDWYALRRRGSADEVGRVVAWLASDDSSYVTGEEIRIDGGNFRGL
jgi:3-oxoacyl-[acyl-carrier protein] reductase